MVTALNGSFVPPPALIRAERDRKHGITDILGLRHRIWGKTVSSHAVTATLIYFQGFFSPSNQRNIQARFDLAWF